MLSPDKTEGGKFCLDGGFHRFFALEIQQIGETIPGRILIPLICTQCGNLKTHELEIK
jgi:hypothetical protein